MRTYIIYKLTKLPNNTFASKGLCIVMATNKNAAQKKARVSGYEGVAIQTTLTLTDEKLPVLRQSLTLLWSPAILYK